MMQPEHLVVLMLVVPFVAMLFVAWGVRGPLRRTLLMWRLQSATDRMTRVLGEELLPAAKSATTVIRELGDALSRSGLVDTGQMRPSVRPPRTDADLDA